MKHWSKISLWHCSKRYNSPSFPQQLANDFSFQHLCRDSHVAISVHTYIFVDVGFFRGLITTSAGRRTLDIDSKAMSHDDVISYFCCCKIDVSDVIQLCYVGKFISANEYSIVKNSGYGTICQHELF